MRKIGIRWEGVGAGTLVALVFGLLLGPVIRGLYDVLTDSPATPQRFTAGLVVASLLGGFLAYLLGGYIAGRFVRSAGGANGAMTAVLGLISSAALGSLGIVSAGGAWVAVMGLSSAELILSVVAVLFLAELFGGYVGGKLGERPVPDFQRFGD